MKVRVLVAYQMEGAGVTLAGALSGIEQRLQSQQSYGPQVKGEVFAAQILPEDVKTDAPLPSPFDVLARVSR